MLHVARLASAVTLLTAFMVSMVTVTVLMATATPSFITKVMVTMVIMVTMAIMDIMDMAMVKKLSLPNIIMAMEVTMEDMATVIVGMDMVTA